jgi:hypothetical protein
MNTSQKNILTSQKEVKRFKTNRTPGPYFAYYTNPGSDFITTWMGDTLAKVTYLGPEYTCPAFGCFPSKRRNFRAIGIDGRKWFGTYFVSSGDYVRMKPVKGRKG